MEKALGVTLERLVLEQSLPGVVAAIGRAEEPITVAAAGMADRESATPMSVDDRLLAASIGKSFVAAMVLELQHERLLHLDDKVSRWLGDRPWFPRLPNGPDITVRMLLNHGAGIPDHIYQEEFMRVRLQRLADPDFVLSPEQSIGMILDKPALFHAGKSFAYSDTAYILAGLIIEAATSRTYYDLLQERLLDPLHLDRISPSNTRRLAGVVPGYLTEGGAFGRREGMPSKVAIDGVMLYNPASEWTGGGLATHPRDLVAWALTLYEEKALAAPYLGDLLTPNPDIEAARKRVGGAYGLGVIIRETEHGPAFGHTGGMPGYSAFMSYYPRYRLAIAMQVNQTTFDIAASERALLDFVLS